VALAAGCAGDVTGDDDDSTGPDADVAAPDAAPAPPDAGAPGAELGTFQLTYYWVTCEEEFSGTPDTSIYDSSCNELAVVPSAFFDSLRLEGTGKLADGRVLNYAGSCPCATSPCFFEVDAEHPWGVGSMNRALVPFRSIAVDPAVIAIGTPVYVAELDGVQMPGDPPTGGFVHDGCVTADDTGGGINGMHIDFFAALRANYLALDAILGLGSVTVHEGGDRCVP